MMMTSVLMFEFGCIKLEGRFIYICRLVSAVEAEQMDPKTLGPHCALLLFIHAHLRVYSVAGPPSQVLTPNHWRRSYHLNILFRILRGNWWWWSVSYGSEVLKGFKSLFSLRSCWHQITNRGLYFLLSGCWPFLCTFSIDTHTHTRAQCVIYWHLKVHHCGGLFFSANALTGDRPFINSGVERLCVELVAPMCIQCWCFWVN